MNKYYLIVPAILLGTFLFFYNGALKEMAAKEAAKTAEKAAIKAADDKRKAEIEAKAAADAKRRQEERDAEERTRLEKKEKEYQDAMKKLKDEADNYSAEADKLAKEGADLEIQLGTLRTQKEKTTREVFELAKQVELAKVNRRNAEIEIQRMVEMLGTRAGSSSLATLPPPPTTKN
jgi:chromosome segregation ATPase